MSEGSDTLTPHAQPRLRENKAEPRLSTRALVSAHNQKGECFRAKRYKPVTERNCVAVKRGGEQQEVFLFRSAIGTKEMISSIRRMRRKLSVRRMTNAIRLIVVVSLRVNGEIQTLEKQGVHITWGSGIKETCTKKRVVQESEPT